MVSQVEAPQPWPITIANEVALANRNGSTTITAVNSNSIDGYAISGVYADMNDPALRRGQIARLAPWT